MTTISFIHTVAAFSGYGFEHGRYDAKLRDAKAQGVHHAKAIRSFTSNGRVFLCASCCKAP